MNLVTLLKNIQLSPFFLQVNNGEEMIRANINDFADDTSLGWILFFGIIGLIFYALTWVVQGFIAPRIKSRKSRNRFKKWFYIVRLLVWLCFTIEVIFTLLVYNFLVFGVILVILLIFSHGFVKDFIYGAIFRLQEIFSVGDKVSIAETVGEIKEIGPFGIELINENRDNVYLPYGKVNGELLRKLRSRGKVEAITIGIEVSEKLIFHVIQNGELWLKNCPWVMNQSSVGIKKNEENTVLFSCQVANASFKTRIEDYLMEKINILSENM